MTAKIHGRSGHGGGNPIGSNQAGSGEPPKGNRDSVLRRHRMTGCESIVALSVPTPR